MRMALAKRSGLGLVAALALAMLSSALALVSAVRAGDVYKNLITANLEQARAIHELEIALLEQGEFTSWYVLNGAPRWIAELNRRKPYFDEWLKRVNEAGLEPDQRQYVDQIEEAFREYDRKRSHVVELYDGGKLDEAKRVLLDEVSVCYNRVYQLCEGLSDANDRDIDAAMLARRIQTRQAGVWVGVCLALAGSVAGGLLWMFVAGVFRPLRRMAEDARQYLKPELWPEAQDEVHALRSCLDGLKSSVAEARSNLALSHRHLLDAEKLASVGRLASGVAHEIRSPLTSLKLRLFSMQRALGDDPSRRTDFQVMSEEITRLDNIIRNFLEFSRPPELRIQPCNLSLLLDKTVELLRYKIDSGNIRLEREEALNLPPVLADSQQARQVFINLLNNAIEALPAGGKVRISVAAQANGEGRPMVVMRFHDNGPGIADGAAARIFDPFFSTKEEGAGLGLWIAHRIMTQHGGALELEESSARGATFAVWIPAARREGDE